MLLSIVIPCYNHGIYIEETIQSVLNVIDFEIHEIIILNDGSTDMHTNTILEEIVSKNPNIQLVCHDNMGLARTRNRGLELARGKYFLPLDSDNLLTEAYLTDGIDFLENNPDYTAAYGNSEMFGAKTGNIHNGPIVFQTLSLYNYIDACALFRKETLKELGGYDDKMPKHGMEDWELWLRLCVYQHKLHYLNQTVQKYRVLSDSMIRSYSKKERDNNLEYIQSKYPGYFDYEGVNKYYFDRFNSSPFFWILKLSIQKYAQALYKYLLNKNKISKF
ncbi:MAG: glycosyltransferase family 2 protein [Chitinophagales bacterium]|jgi:glycosyltransferase involved in cell wall biosynthesis|nr:glycosyltransferase family 2 protein [Sphingobacteriales bacterium]